MKLIYHDCLNLSSQFILTLTQLHFYNEILDSIFRNLYTNGNDSVIRNFRVSHRRTVGAARRGVARKISDAFAEKVILLFSHLVANLI